jgi:hypothetical protein
MRRGDKQPTVVHCHQLDAYVQTDKAASRAIEDTTYIQTQYMSHDRLATALSLCNVTPDVPRSLCLDEKRRDTDHPKTTDTSLDLARGPPADPPSSEEQAYDRGILYVIDDEPPVQSQCSLEAVWTLIKRSTHIIEG